VNGAGKSFTLAEMIVVIAIIVVLSALLLPAVQRARRHIRKERCRTMIAKIELALEMYRTDFGVYPPSGNNNANTTTTSWTVPVVVNLHGALTTLRRGGPYISFRPEEVDRTGLPPGQARILDPWGRPYVFTSSTRGQTNPPWHNTRTFDIYSFGPDGRTHGGITDPAAAGAINNRNAGNPATGDVHTRDDINNW
jgi:type II secretory pathway pseudopilin PulG